MTNATSPDPSALPADAQLWLHRLQQGEASPWAEAEIEILPPGVEPQLLDTSYLTPADLAHPDTAANVLAIADTAALVTWIAQTPEKAYGYWRGPDDVPLARAPLVEHDTEGQFYLVGASSLTEALAFYVAELDDNLDEVAAQCRAAGVTVEIRDIHDWVAPEVAVDPRDFHDARFRQRRDEAKA